MSVLEGLEAKLKAFVEDAVREAEASAPAIDAAIFAALQDAGAPAPLAQVLSDGLKMILDHFEADHAAQPAPPAPEAAADPGTPGA